MPKHFLIAFIMLLAISAGISPSLAAYSAQYSTNMRFEAENFNEKVSATPSSSGNYYSILPNGYLKFSNVNCKYGALSFIARCLKATSTVGTLDIRIGSLSAAGNLLDIPQSGTSWLKLQCSLAGAISGTRDIFLVNTSQATFAIDNFELVVKTDATLHFDAPTNAGVSNFIAATSLPTGETGETALAQQAGGTSWIKFSDVDLAYGAYSAKIRLQYSGVANTSSTIDIRIDSPTGDATNKIGSISASTTTLLNCQDVEYRFPTQSTLKGTHDVYFVFNGAANCSFLVEWLELAIYPQPALHIEAEYYSGPSNGIQKTTTSTTPPITYIGYCDQGRWLMYPGKDLKWGIASIKARAARDGPWYGGRIEFWIDGITNVTGVGKKLGDLWIWGTGGWETFTDQKNDFYGKGGGIHDLYIYFAEGYGIGNFDWFELALNGDSLIRRDAESFDGEDSTSSISHYSPTYISGFSADSWVRYNNIDMKGGATNIDIKLSKTATATNIEVRLDGPHGILLGTLQPQTTSGIDNFVIQSQPLIGATLEEARGIHDLYLVFTATAFSNTFRIDWFELTLKRMPYYRWEADWYDAQGGSGGGIYVISGEPRTIGGCDDGDWVRYDNVDMHNGAIAFKARMARDGSGYNGYIEVWASDHGVPYPPTKFLGRLASNGTGGWGTYNEQATDLVGDAIQGADNIKDLYLCFKNGGGICNLDWFELTFEDGLSAQKIASQSAYLDDIVYERDLNNKIALQYKNIGADGRMTITDGQSQTAWPRYCYLKDHLGSTRMVIDQYGNANEIALYRAYGAVSYLCPVAGTENTKEKFTGKELDQDGKLDMLISINLSVSGFTPATSGTGTYKLYLDGANSTPAYSGSFTINTQYGLYYSAYLPYFGGNHTITRLDIDVPGSGGCSGGNISYSCATLNKAIAAGNSMDINYAGAASGLCGNGASVLTYTPHELTPLAAGVGLVYFGARYYDPEIGYWTTCDPDEQFFNPYAYVGNGQNPIGFKDQNGELQAPVYDAGVSLNTGDWGGRFGAGRPGRSNLHTGQDFNRIAYGTSVVAVAAGKVASVGNTGASGAGRYVIIDHGDGKISMYQHLSAQNVNQGQKVSEGQKIGESGTSGTVVGVGEGSSVVHLEIIQNKELGDLSGSKMYSTFFAKNAEGKLVFSRSDPLNTNLGEKSNYNAQTNPNRTTAQKDVQSVVKTEARQNQQSNSKSAITTFIEKVSSLFKGFISSANAR